MSKQKKLMLVGQNETDCAMITELVDTLPLMLQHLPFATEPQQIVASINAHQPDLLMIDEVLLATLDECNLPPLLLIAEQLDGAKMAEFTALGVNEVLFSPLQRAHTQSCLQRQAMLLQRQQTTEAYVRQSLKLHELGELVGLVSHEVASPLGNINTAVSFLLESCHTIQQRFDSKTLAASELDKFLQRLNKALSMSIKNGANASGIISSFRTVASNQCFERLNQFYLHRYLDDIVLTLKSKLKKLPHEIHIVISESVDMTSYSGALAQVIVGLISQSIAYGFDDKVAGKIIINATLDKQADIDTVIIDYIDDGKGIEAQTLATMFSKEKQTIHSQSHMHLNTAMLKNIVEQQLQGTMTLRSELGKGVHCTLSLPQRLS